MLLTDLPNEILFMILLKLQVKDLGRVAQTNKQLNIASNESSLWTELYRRWQWSNRQAQQKTKEDYKNDCQIITVYGRH